jgi:hypothetical protein
MADSVDIWEEAVFWARSDFGVTTFPTEMPF